MGTELADELVHIDDGPVELHEGDARAEERPAPGSQRHRQGGHKESGDCQIDRDRQSTRLNSSHVRISYAVFCLKKKKPVGHVLRPMLTIPLGVRARLVAEGEGKLEILEPAVTARLKAQPN